MIKKRLLAIAFSCILAVSAIPVMPVWHDAVSVKADEITVEKTEYEGPQKQAPERQTIYHTVDENDKRNGSISLPSDRNTQAVDPSISIYDAKEMLVNSENEAFEKKINPLRGRIGEEVNENLPSAWPAGYEENNELYYHFNTYLPPLRDQGSYGSCWTHGVLGTVESYLINNEGSEDLHGRINRNSNGTLPGINYSELHLAYFSYHNLPNPIIKDQGADFVNLENIGNNTSFLDFGGVDTVGVKTLMNWRGTVDELLLPYTLADELIVSDSEKYAISGIPDEFAYLNDIAHISNAYMINIHENALQVKQAIKENGAVSVSYYSDSDYYDAANNSYFNYKRTIGNHAVCIVGWDDNFPKEKFNTEYSFSPKPQNDGAWLIRNSWIDTLKYPDDDVKLSDKGYFWISYEDLSLSDALVIEAESSDNYDNNYYYTNQVSTEYTETAFDTVANVFTINGIQKAEKEKIDAIVIDTADANVSYSIFICSVDEDGKPDTLNKLCEETTGTIVFPGIYTIPLTDPVTLSRGEKFAVVVSTENGNVASEWALRMGDEKSYLISNCGATPGQSFGYDDEYGWIDYSEYYIGNDGFIGNFYIQVMTSNEGNDSEKRIEGLRVIDRRQKDSLTIGWNSLGDGVKYDIYRALQEDEEYTLIESDYT